MPTIYEVVAKEFDVQHDVDDAFSAASFRVRYENVGQARAFDPTIFNNLKIYRGEVSPDMVRVKATVNDVEAELILGIVDDNGWTDRNGGVAEGTLAGRDLMALALDKHPSSAFTIAAGTSFKVAVADLATKAGLTSSVFCDDYTIASPVPVTTDMSLGSALQRIIEPLRWSEKSRVDAWVDGSVLVVAKRDYTSPPRGIVTLNASRLVTDRMEKSAVVKVGDVRVEGVRSKLIITDPNFPSSGKTVTDHQVVITPDGKNHYVVDTEEQYDGQGRLLRRELFKVWYIRGGLASVRSEHEHDDFTFWDTGVQPEVPYFGAPKDQVSYHDITDAWPTAAPTESGTVRVEETTVHYEYYSDNGDPKAQTESEKTITEDGASKPSQWQELNTVTNKRWYRMGPYTMQVIQVTQYQNGAVIASQTNRQIGPYKLASATQGTAGANQQVIELQASAGPDPEGFVGLLRREQSDLLNSAGCTLVRGYLTDENNFVKVVASFRTPYDHGIRAGKLLVVQGAPSWWPLTTFYVVAVRLSDGEGLDCDLECIAWVASP